MEQITLRFPNLQRLLQFKEVIRLKTFVLDLTELTLCAANVRSRRFSLCIARLQRSNSFIRKGTDDLHVQSMAGEPLKGKRHGKVHETKTKREQLLFVKQIAEKWYA